MFSTVERRGIRSIGEGQRKGRGMFKELGMSNKDTTTVGEWRFERHKTKDGSGDINKSRTTI